MQLLSDIYFQRYPWGTICNLTDIRVRSNDAIRYVRLKRPNMVQTRRQIQCVKEFETYFLPQVKSFSIRFFPACNQNNFTQNISFQCVVYSTKPPNERDKKLGRFPVETCLKRFSSSSSMSIMSIFRQKYLNQIEHFQAKVPGVKVPESNGTFSGKSTWCMVSKRGR